MKITVITGPMKSGKSKKIIEYIKQSSNYLVFKPSIDDRDFGEIKSRNGQSVKAININSFSDIFSYIDKDIKAIFIDETQFLNDVENIKMLIFKLNAFDIDLIVSGLDLDSNFNIFKATSIFMSYAHDIIKLSSICECCNTNNSYVSYCSVEKTSQILTGDNI